MKKRIPAMVAVTKDDLVVRAEDCPIRRECARLSNGVGTWCPHFHMFIDTVAIYCKAEEGEA